jgi:hypothetical protein
VIRPRLTGVKNLAVARNKSSLWLLTGALVVGGGALIVAALLWPLERFGNDSQQSIGPIAARDAGPPPLASFEPAWAVNLRRPLNDNEVITGAVSGATQPSADAGVGVRLVGTIVDAQRPRGIFVTPLGQMELRGVGEKTAGAQILRIDERSATLSVAGREVTLRVEKLESSVPSIDSTAAPPPSARSGP